MNDGMGPGNLLDTTDSLEAVGVFRGWKNFMFLIVLLCLLAVQAGFWLVNIGTIPVEAKGEAEITAAAPTPVDANAPADPNAPAEAGTKKSGIKALLPQKMDYELLGRILTLVNAILILTACVYVLTTMFSLKVSMTGKLGGINHIGRAFFLSLFMFVLLLPWQKIFPGIVIGAVYTPAELKAAYLADRSNLLDNILYYLRFSGYWFIVFFMLILSQMRTCRWTRAILRRLEVV
ncbi:MAG: hypothetical protein JW720_07095 [Sedimentisphaerales bacterium]|nr:hypothetical protein [Sedimentisphaerales bacterium]